MNVLLPQLLPDDAPALGQQRVELELRAEVVQLQHGRKAGQRRGRRVGVERVREVQEVQQHLRADARHEHGRELAARLHGGRAQGPLLRLRLHKVVQVRSIDLEHAQVGVEQVALAAAEANVRQQLVVHQRRDAGGKGLVRLCDREVVHAPAGHLENSLSLEARGHERRGWLVGIPVAVHRHALAATKAELPARAGAPAVQVPRGRDSQGVRLSARNVDDALVTECLQHGGRGEVWDPVWVLADSRVVGVHYPQLSA
mmetsp:Transcript_65560/g.185963  ORF Transcript_65560/g.185963 Transcript_65560/m.185963 type:complete len:257 (+) Transcript_65560:940-1710(+)